MKKIATIAELIAELGGDTEVADWLGISQSAVAHWKLRNQIGAGWHLRILAEAADRDLEVDPSVFGLSPTEAASLFGRIYRHKQAGASVPA